jgi:tetratricopeptide (TPR) repeat protein
MGLEALELLPRGGLWWCKVAERLFNVLPTIGQLDSFYKLIQKFDSVEPTPQALSAYACAAGYGVAIFGITGARELASRWRSLLHNVRASIPEEDAFTHGSIQHGHAWAVRTIEADPYLAMSLGQDSESAFQRAKHPVMLSLSRSVLGLALADLAAFTEAEETLNKSLSVAREARDPYTTANAQAYLSITLVQLEEPLRLDEVEHLAGRVIETNVSPAYTGIARLTLASAFLSRGQLSSAEAEARQARELLSVIPPYVPAALAVLAKALRGQNRPVEAKSVADDGFELLAKLGGTGWSEVPFRVAAAEALDAAGDRDAARAALREALHQIAIRADRIPDAVWRERYLSGRSENRRAFELAREWLVAVKPRL